VAAGESLTPLPAGPVPDAVPLATPAEEGGDLPLAAPVAEAAPAAPTTITCAACGTVNPLTRSSCDDCGYYFTPPDLPPPPPRPRSAPAAGAGAPAPRAPPPPRATWLQARSAAGPPISERRGVERFRAPDQAAPPRPAPVVIARQPLPRAAEAVAEPAVPL